MGKFCITKHLSETQSRTKAATHDLTTEVTAEDSTCSLRNSFHKTPLRSSQADIIT